MYSQPSLLASIGLFTARLFHNLRRVPYNPKRRAFSLVRTRPFELRHNQYYTPYDKSCTFIEFVPLDPRLFLLFVFLSFVKQICVSVTTLYTCVDVLVWVGGWVCVELWVCVCVYNWCSSVGSHDPRILAHISPLPPPPSKHAQKSHIFSLLPSKQIGVKIGPLLL
jgi:hypothetical protein